MVVGTSTFSGSTAEALVEEQNRNSAAVSNVPTTGADGEFNLRQRVSDRCALIGLQDVIWSASMECMKAQKEAGKNLKKTNS
jgi:hypothetical protein